MHLKPKNLKSFKLQDIFFGRFYGLKSSILVLFAS